MSNRIRTKPNRKNSSLIQGAKAASIIQSNRIGIRNIIDAERQLVVCHGLDVPDAKGSKPSPVNFHPYYPIRFGSIIYEGRNAVLSVTHGHISYAHQPGDPSSIFAPNPMAEELFLKSDYVSYNYYRAMGGVFGDAVLITDTRQHWSVCSQRLTTPSQADDLSASLITPHLRSNRYSGTGIPDIVFVEEPCAEDLIQLTMMFG